MYNDFLKSANAQVLPQTLRTLDRAWEDMKKHGFGFPHDVYFAKVDKDGISQTKDKK